MARRCREGVRPRRAGLGVVIRRVESGLMVWRKGFWYSESGAKPVGSVEGEEAVEWGVLVQVNLIIGRQILAPRFEGLVDGLAVINKGTEENEWWVVIESGFKEGVVGGEFWLGPCVKYFDEGGDGVESGLRPTVSGGGVEVVPCGGETTVFEAIY